MTPAEWRERLVFEIGDGHAFPSERRYLAALLREWDAHEPFKPQLLGPGKVWECRQCGCVDGTEELCPARRRMMGET